MAFPRTVWLVTLMFLVGCAAPPAATPPTPTNSSAVPSASPTASVLAAMPAADGRPMLWPARLVLESAPEFGGSPDVRYGFVDVRGKLVVPQRYEDYVYCPDATGRTAFLIASLAGRRAEVFDLGGKLLTRTPTATAECGGADHVVITEDVWGETDRHNSGLVNVTTGKVVVPVAKDRHVDVVDARTVNVSDPSGEYFLDLTTGKRTPHKGWLLVYGGTGDGKLLAAGAQRRRDSSTGAKVGFVDRSGAWAVPAEFEDATGFANGYSSVKIGEQYTFLNAAFQRVGGVWDEVRAIEGPGGSVLGYRVTLASDQGLLGPDLRVVVPPGPVSITCDGEASGACSVVAGASATLVVLPEGTTTAMPAGFSQALSPFFLADEVDPDFSDSNRVYAISAGVTVELAGTTSCTGVGTAWAACDSGSGMAPPVVIDTAGRVTPFATAQAVPDPSPDKGVAYYWVTAGTYQGFVDAKGTWRYRESCFTQLED